MCKNPHACKRERKGSPPYEKTQRFRQPHMLHFAVQGPWLGACQKECKKTCSMHQSDQSSHCNKWRLGSTRIERSWMHHCFARWNQTCILFMFTRVGHPLKRGGVRTRYAALHRSCSQSPVHQGSWSNSVRFNDAIFWSKKILYFTGWYSAYEHMRVQYKSQNTDLFS